MTNLNIKNLKIIRKIVQVITVLLSSSIILVIVVNGIITYWNNGMVLFLILLLVINGSLKRYLKQRLLIEQPSIISNPPKYAHHIPLVIPSNIHITNIQNQNSNQQPSPTTQLNQSPVPSQRYCNLCGRRLLV